MSVSVRISLRQVLLVGQLVPLDRVRLDHPGEERCRGRVLFPILSTYKWVLQFSVSISLTLLELARYRRPKVPRSERICTICSSEVENKICFVLGCSALVNTRKPLLEKCIELLENFQTSMDIEKLYFILNNLIFKLVAKLICQMFQLRKSL